MPKKNPLNLNALQLKTLTLLQELARLPDHGRPAQEPGAVIVTNLPQPHGDHFHVGDAVVATRDATGLANLAAWLALERKRAITAVGWWPLAAMAAASRVRSGSSPGAAPSSSPWMPPVTSTLSMPAAAAPAMSVRRLSPTASMRRRSAMPSRVKQVWYTEGNGLPCQRTRPPSAS